jgi:hypothetical protein
MQWIAPAERDTDADALENRLWAVADQLRTEVVKPYHGRILDPACGSGSTFAKSPLPFQLSGITFFWRSC